MNEVSEKEIDQKTPTFINNFDRVEPYVVYNYFKKELVDKKFLTEQELNEYLKYAFEIKEVPIIRFRIKNARTKSVIVAVFYYYFNILFPELELDGFYLLYYLRFCKKSLIERLTIS